MVFTAGIGFTVIVKLTGVPLHPPAVGVTVIVEIIFVLPLLVALNGLISPLPLAANPVEELLFVQLNVVPVTFNADVKMTALVVVPLHIT